MWMDYKSLYFESEKERRQFSKDYMELVKKYNELLASLKKKV